MRESKRRRKKKKKKSLKSAHNPASELKLENPPIRNQFPEHICGFERLGSMRGRKGYPTRWEEQSDESKPSAKRSHNDMAASFSFSRLYSSFFKVKTPDSLRGKPQRTTIWWLQGDFTIKSTKTERRIKIKKLTQSYPLSFLCNKSTMRVHNIPTGEEGSKNIF